MGRGQSGGYELGERLQLLWTGFVALAVGAVAIQNLQTRIIKDGLSETTLSPMVQESVEFKVTQAHASLAEQLSVIETDVLP